MKGQLSPEDELLALDHELHGLDSELSLLRIQHQFLTEQIEKLELGRRILQLRQSQVVELINGD